MAYPDFKQPFLLHTDASDAAIGAVLSQVQEGTERVIAYWSRKLQKAEKNYTTTEREREALAVVASLKEFYPYVYGFPCKLITDHNPLTSLKGIKDVGGRLADKVCMAAFPSAIQLRLPVQARKVTYKCISDSIKG